MTRILDFLKFLFKFFCYFATFLVYAVAGWYIGEGLFFPEGIEAQLRAILIVLIGILYIGDTWKNGG